MATHASHRKPGRQPKGVRHQLTVRVPIEQFAVYQAEADAEGLSVADYLTAALARQHGLAEPDYVYRGRRRDEGMLPLPLTGTG